jgi:long-subunit acyl-CoA synthetase (AMP-forming)
MALREGDGAHAQPATLPAAIAAQAALRPDAVAVRHKRLGIWHVLTWRDLAARVAGLAQGLARRGVGRGTALVLLAHPRLEALLLTLAAQSLGARAVPLDPLQPRERLHGLLAGLRPRFVFADGQALVDRVLAAEPAPELLVYADARGLAQYRHPALLSCAALDEAGAAFAPAPAADDTAFVFYRLDDAGQLEAQHHTHRELLAEAWALVEHEGLTAREEALAARAFSGGEVARYLLGPWLAAGFTLNFPENGDTRDNDRRELGPTLVLGTRATYARVAQLAFDGLPAPGTLVRRLVDAALAPAAGPLARVAGRWLVRRPLREVLGFARLRTPLLVGDGLDARTRDLLHALGIDVHAWPELHGWRPGRADDTAAAAGPAPDLRWRPA